MTATSTVENEMEYVGYGFLIIVGILFLIGMGAIVLQFVCMALETLKELNNND
jgi:hypothetical protein